MPDSANSLCNTSPVPKISQIFTKPSPIRPTTSSPLILSTKYLSSYFSLCVPPPHRCDTNGCVIARVPHAQCAGNSLHSKPKSQPGRPTQPSATCRAPNAPERSRVPCDMRLMQSVLCRTCGAHVPLVLYLIRVASACSSMRSCPVRLCCPLYVLAVC